MSKGNPGEHLYGEKGTYIIGDKIGDGGNSRVYQVKAIASSEKSIQITEEYAVKFFCCNKKGNELKKREERFNREIAIVRKLQNNVDGIMPIVDLPVEQGTEHWFLMPLAQRYNYVSADLRSKLDCALRLAAIVANLHSCEGGFAHRDIKPNNILLFQQKVFISDFGLAWETGCGENRITEYGDRLGPIDFLPPEMIHMTNRKVDYQKSDVYMLARTIWSILKNSRYSFLGEYKRNISAIYLDPEEEGISVFEPIHLLMEGATRYDFQERISAADMVKLLTIQRDIVDGTYDKSATEKLRTQEALSQAILHSWTDRTVYKGSASILYILNALNNVAKVSVEEYENSTEIGVLLGVSQVEETVFIVSVAFGDYDEKKYAFCFNEVTMKEDRTLFIV